MARRRQRRRGEKQRRHASRSVAIPSAHDLKSTDRLEQLAYTRKQAAEALGVSLATLDSERARGESIGEITRKLNADGVPTAQGGRNWWPSTVRAVLVRSDPSKSADTMP
jgi:hypothetical protein